LAEHIERELEARSSTKPNADGDEGLSKMQIRDEVRNHLPQIRQCYETALTKNSQLEGRFAVRFVIDAQGQVIEATQASDASTLLDEALSACILSEAKRFKFTPPQGGGFVKVTYPFILSPG